MFNLLKFILRGSRKLSLEKEQSARYPSAFIHPTAFIQKTVSLESNSQIGKNVSLRGNISIGKGTLINGPSIISASKDVHIEIGCFIKFFEF